MQFSKRLDSFPEYIFSQLGKKKREVEIKTGKKVLDLSIGSPDYPPSEIYIKMLKNFITEEGMNSYPGYGARPEFSEALVNWYQTRFGVNVDTNELLPLLGGKDGVSHIVLALTDPDDEILIPDPGYPGFSGPALMFGVKPVFYFLTEKNNFKIDINTLENKVSKKTKAIWVNFPSNPTGQVATLEELEPLVKFAKAHEIVLIYDNAYAEITFDGFIAPSILQIPEAIDVAVEIGSFSKSYSFAGQRMGWITGNKQVIAGLAKVKSQLDSGMYAPLQKLGAYALNNHDRIWNRRMLESYRKRRDTLANVFSKLGLKYNLPKGGLYLWVKIPEHEIDSEVYTFKLLEERLILVAPGTAFGNMGKRYVRVCFSANIENIDNYISP